jgi:prephenate dehydrogenase
VSVQRLAVVGTGLIGASIGLAARDAGVGSVRGFDRDRRALAMASALGAVEPAPSLPDAVAAAELVVVAVPPRHLAATVAGSAAAAPADCVVTDTGSIKRGVCAANEEIARFVGGHPLCGAASRGPELARADMFRGATWFLTPTGTTDCGALERVEAFVAVLGAMPVRIAADVHDRAVALTSHLPHALANLLVEQLQGERIDGVDPLDFPTRFLRETTRVAGANPDVWRDIFLENRDFVAASLAKHRRLAEELERALAAGDSAFVGAWIDRASAARARLLERDG